MVSEQIRSYGMEFVEIPVFTGEELRHWIYWMEQYFASYDDFTDLQKQPMAYGFMGGEAKVWFNRRQSWCLFSSWKMIKTSLLLRFGDKEDPERIRLQEKHKQLLQQWRQNKTHIDFVQLRAEKTKSTTPHASFPLKSEAMEKEVTCEHKLTLARDSHEEEELRKDTKDVKEVKSDGVEESFVPKKETEKLANGYAFVSDFDSQGTQEYFLKGEYFAKCISCNLVCTINVYGLKHKLDLMFFFGTLTRPPEIFLELVLVRIGFSSVNLEDKVCFGGGVLIRYK